MNWLIVEDEADIRNLVAMMCQVWGNVPMTYESGQKAWDWLDAVEAGTYNGDLPDFALMDIRMPGKRGNEISARIRKVSSLENIPIVLMTAFVMSEEEMTKMKTEFGVDAVINKPLPDFDRLRTVLYDIIEKKKKEVESKPKADAAATPPPEKPTEAPKADATKPAEPAPKDKPAATPSDATTKPTDDKDDKKAEAPKADATKVDTTTKDTPTPSADVTRPSRETPSTSDDAASSTDSTTGDKPEDKPASDQSDKKE